MLVVHHQIYWFGYTDRSCYNYIADAADDVDNVLGNDGDDDDADGDDDDDHVTMII